MRVVSTSGPGPLTLRTLAARRWRYRSVVGAYLTDLDLARSLAEIADRISLSRFRARDLQFDTKPDLTPVSDADRAVEQALRGELAATRPGDAVCGEEFGLSGDSPRQWVIDPIDGTKNYVRGVPVWATLIALLDAGDPVVGMVSAPALGRRWWAARGDGAWGSTTDGDVHRLQVSGVRTIADASLSYSSLGGWGGPTERAAILTLIDEVWRSRAFGDFWSYMLVAEGAAEIALDPVVSLWDMAAAQVIVEEAGGRQTDLSGRPDPGGGSGLATNGLLHEAALAIVGQASA
jgi:histidinol-phosphatase